MSRKSPIVERIKERIAEIQQLKRDRLTEVEYLQREEEQLADLLGTGSSASPTKPPRKKKTMVELKPDNPTETA